LNINIGKTVVKNSKEGQENDQIQGNTETVEFGTKEEGNRGELLVFEEYSNAGATTNGRMWVELPIAGGNDR